ncbi:MAG: tetratricopeptide repeat protein [Treponema sp.]|nr:tetratricopeptide repeat protein [Treponema sp.]
MKRFRIKCLTAALACLFLLSGCADTISGARGRLLVARANVAFERGRTDQAIGLYLRALEYEAAAPYAEYGLGLIFFSLGEDAAALGRFERAAEELGALPESLHRELRFRNHYNSGVVLFGKGDFDGAAGSFRDALRISGGRAEAMRNLELSLLSIEQETSARSRAGASEQSEAMSLAFDRIRQMEAERWRGRQWPEEEPAPGDDR